MENYKPNSHKYKAEQRQSEGENKAEKIIKGSVKVKQKGELTKLKDRLISGDASTIKSFIFDDIVMPTAKKMFHETLTGIADILCYGSRGRDGRRGVGDRVSYTAFSDDRYKARRYSEERERSGYMYSDIVFDNRGDAERVLDKLEDTLSRYGLVSIADLNEYVGIRGSHTDCKYGWTGRAGLRGAKVDWTRDGYIITLPKAEPLD